MLILSKYQVIDTQTKLYLVLELGDGGDMYDYIMKHEGGLGEEVARKYFRQIVTASSTATSSTSSTGTSSRRTWSSSRSSVW